VTDDQIASLESNVHPRYGVGAFTCPHCGVLSAVEWLQGIFLDSPREPVRDRDTEILGVQFARCQSLTCKGGTIWRGKANLESGGRDTLGERWIVRRWGKDSLSDAVLMWPAARIGPRPNSDLPTDIQADMNEARDVLSTSPRSALTLSRIALEKLCEHLGHRGASLNEAIGEMVKQGVPPLVQQAFDVVRINGNQGAHPSKAEAADLRSDAITVLGLINVIAERLITQPKQVQALYDAIPQAKRDAIHNRDVSS
jgi:hypothetical protein